MARTILDQSLLEKLAQKLNKPAQYVREQIRKRASRYHVSSEAFFVHWLGTTGIGAERYRRSLSSPIQEEIRSLQSTYAANSKNSRQVVRQKRLSRAKKRLAVKTLELDAKPPFLTSSTIGQASKNAELYPFLFALENAVRVLIVVVMERNYGPSWWSTKVKEPIRNSVIRRKRTEQLNPWSGGRGSIEINYTDFADLANILRANMSVFTPLFKGIKNGLNFLTHRLDELEGTRNNLAHTCPLKDRDRRRLQLYFEEIYDILDTLKERLP